MKRALPDHQEYLDPINVRFFKHETRIQLQILNDISSTNLTYIHLRQLYKDLYLDLRSRQKTSSFILFEVFYGRYKQKHNFEGIFGGVLAKLIFPTSFQLKTNSKVVRFLYKPTTNRLSIYLAI